MEHRIDNDARVAMIAAFDAFLRAAGHDVSRDGLKRTPTRVMDAFLEMTAGEYYDPATELDTVFEQDADDAPVFGGMVILRNIAFASLCEHHVLPFTGTAHVAYIPGDDHKIVGISKLARVVDGYARRLQVQERLTSQILGAIVDRLNPLGAMVIIEGEHHCMKIRGARQPNATMSTDAVFGLLDTDSTARDEAMRLMLRS